MSIVPSFPVAVARSPGSPFTWVARGATKEALVQRLWTRAFHVSIAASGVTSNATFSAITWKYISGFVRAKATVASGLNFFASICTQGRTGGWMRKFKSDLSNGHNRELREERQIRVAAIALERAPRAGAGEAAKHCAADQRAN